MSALQLQPVEVADHPFLRQVYAATREDEVARTGWDADTVARFLRMQFDAQHAHYVRHYPRASFDIVLDAGVPAGRLYVSRAAQQLHIIDIALLPAFRQRGIGTTLLGGLQREAQVSGRSITIHVEFDNPAQRLYQRLGFVAMSESGFHRLMQWQPEPLN